MNEHVYRVYKQSKMMIAEYAKNPEEDDHEFRNFVGDLSLSCVLLEEKMPEYKRRYDEEQLHNNL